MERKELLTVVLIGILLITVGIQTVQLVSMKSTQAMPMMSAGSGSANAPVSSGSPSVPTSLQNLPTMVGGC